MSKVFTLFVSLFVWGSLLAQANRPEFYLDYRIDNDALYYPRKTDRYFTSGMRLRLGRVIDAPSHLRPLGTMRCERYWTVTQHIYTPEDITSVSTEVRDRPFASFLTADYGRGWFDETLGVGVTRKFTVGVLGRFSGGGRLQNAFHQAVKYADVVPGWTNEVRPDVVLNYEVALDRTLLRSRHATLTTRATGRLGTLFTNAAIGTHFSWLPFGATRSHGFALRAGGGLRAVAYDATLTGGLFNRDDRYRGVVQPRPVVARGDVDARLWLGNIELSAGVRYLTPEFTGGGHHAWAFLGGRVWPSRTPRR